MNLNWPRFACTLCACTVLALALPAAAQDEAPSPPASAAAPDPAFQSPHATLRTFLDAMGRSEPDRDRAIECMDTSDIVKEARWDIASRLYRCINRIEWIDFEHDRSIPRAADLADPDSPFAGLVTWTYFPRNVRAAHTGYYLSGFAKDAQIARVQKLAPDATIVLDKTAGGEWKFSAHTVAGVEAFWDHIRKLDPVSELSGREYLTFAQRLESLWPDYLVEHSFLHVKYWQWISLFLLILLGVILDFSLRFILSVLSRRWIARRGGQAKPETLRKMVRPFGLALAALLWLWGITALGLPSEALRVLAPAVRLFAMLAMVWAGFRVTDLLGEVFLSKAEKTDTKFDDLLVPLVRKTVKIFIAVFGLIYIAGSFGQDIGPLLAGLGIGGVGFAFAAKDTLEHFFGSVTVIADRPFQVGDWVLIGDTEGTVEEVGFRSTRIRTFYNSLVTIPNGNLVRATVDNFGKRKYRRWSTHVNLTYDTPPEKIEAFCEGVRELVRLHPYTRKDYYQIWLHHFGAHSLDILIYVFWKTPDWQTELRERHRLMLDMLRLADRLGVQFAFPTQTLHLHQEDRDAEHLPAEVPPKGVEILSHRSGRTAARNLTAQASWREKKPPPYRFRYAGETADEDGDDTQIESKIGGDAE